MLFQAAQVPKKKSSSDAGNVSSCTDVSLVVMFGFYVGRRVKMAPGLSVVWGQITAPKELRCVKLIARV